MGNCLSYVVFFTNRILLRIRDPLGWLQSELIVSRHFLLNGHCFNNYSGFNLQVIGNKIPESFSTDKDTTRTVFIAIFKDEEY